MPPFNITNKDKINKQLNSSAIVDGFINIPVYNQMNESKWSNKLNDYSCKYVHDYYANYKNDSNYGKDMWLKDLMKDSYAIEFNLN